MSHLVLIAICLGFPLKVPSRKLEKGNVRSCPDQGAMIIAMHDLFHLRLLALLDCNGVSLWYCFVPEV